MADFALGRFPPAILEVNFEQVAPRSIGDLLRDVTFASSFIEQAVEAAGQQGIESAQGVALLYNFDYRLNPAGRSAAGPLKFIGAFPFARSKWSNLGRFRELAYVLGYSLEAIAFVTKALGEINTKRRNDGVADDYHLTAREFCEFLVRCQGDATPAMLRDLGLRRSEDIGRIIFGLVNAGLVRSWESESEAGFESLFQIG